MFILFLVHMAFYPNDASANFGDRPILTLKILKPNNLNDVGAKIRKGHSWIPMQCGDGQQYAFDGVEDNIWTCQYIGPIGESERLYIGSSQVSQPLFDGLLSIPNTSSIEIGFQVKQVNNKWTARRTALHQNNFVNNLMVTDREWIIALWSILIVHFMGISIWISRKTQQHS